MIRRFSLPSKRSGHRPTASSSLPPLHSSISPISPRNPPTRSSSLPSPTPSLTHEYSIAVKTDSYNEIWSKIHHFNSDDTILTAATSSSAHLLVSQLLQPNRELVDEALQRFKPTHLTLLVSAYFNHSERASHLLYLILHHSIIQAQSLYAPLLDLLDVLPVDSFSQPQCNQAFDVFTQFSLLDNPFPYPISDAFQETRLCFSELKQQLDYRLRKARKRTRFGFFSNSVQCLGTLVSNPLKVSHSFPTRIEKKQVRHIAQLDAASKGAYVLNNDLDTIDRLVARLHGVVESDKVLVKIGLERGRDRYPIQEVVKQLRKNHHNFLSQLKDLEEHVCLCFATVNRARALLLQEIHLQENMPEITHKSHDV